MDAQITVPIDNRVLVTHNNIFAVSDTELFILLSHVCPNVCHDLVRWMDAFIATNVLNRASAKKEYSAKELCTSRFSIILSYCA
jgi:hypothetical protein